MVHCVSVLFGYVLGSFPKTQLTCINGLTFDLVLAHTTWPIRRSFAPASLICVRQFLEDWHNQGISNAAFDTDFKSFRLICKNWIQGNNTHRTRDKQVLGRGIYNHNGRKEEAAMYAEAMVRLKFELDNIVSIFSSDENLGFMKDEIQVNRQGMNLEQIEVLLIANTLDPKFYRFL